MAREIYNYRMLNELARVVTNYSPNKAIDFGTHIGTTVRTIANALKPGATVYTYDKGGDNKDVGNIRYRDVDFFEWINRDEIEHFDLLYIDIHNDGDIIKLTHEKLYDRIQAGIPILFEGGTPERDGIRPEATWMLRKTPMHPLKDILNYEILADDFPGISMFKVNE